MKLPTRTVTVAAAAVLLAATTVPAQQPTARQLVDRHVEAIGGRERIQAVQSRHLVYEMKMDGSVMTMSVWQSRPNLGRSAIQTPVGEVLSGTDGTTAYAGTAASLQVLQGPQAQEVLRGSAFDADLLFDAFETMEVTGRAEYGGRPCWNVRMVAATGTEQVRCFDVETGRVVAVSQLQGGTSVTAFVDAYREFDGISYPARTSAQSGGQTVVITLKSVDHAPIPASFFAVPETGRQ